MWGPFVGGPDYRIRKGDIRPPKKVPSLTEIPLRAQLPSAAVSNNNSSPSIGLSGFIAALKRHPVLSGVLAALILVFAFLSFWIGYIQMVVVLVPVTLIAGWLLRRRHAKGGSEDRAEAIAAVSYIALATVATFALIQAIPYGRSEVKYDASRSGEPTWDSDATRQLVKNACYDCHSNEVKYPLYSKIAPISWMVASHVGEGRSKLNFSTYTTNKRGFRDVVEVVQNGSMPPSYFTHFGRHPEAKLTDAQIQQLVAGLKATFGSSVSQTGDRGGEHDGDSD